MKECVVRILKFTNGLFTKNQTTKNLNQKNIIHIFKFKKLQGRGRGSRFQQCIQAQNYDTICKSAHGT